MNATGCRRGCQASGVPEQRYDTEGSLSSGSGERYAALTERECRALLAAILDLQWLAVKWRWGMGWLVADEATCVDVKLPEFCD